MQEQVNRPLTLNDFKLVKKVIDDVIHFEVYNTGKEYYGSFRAIPDRLITGKKFVYISTRTNHIARTKLHAALYEQWRSEEIKSLLNSYELNYYFLQNCVANEVIRYFNKKYRDTSIFELVMEGDKEKSSSFKIQVKASFQDELMSKEQCSTMGYDSDKLRDAVRDCYKEVVNTFEVMTSFEYNNIANIYWIHIMYTDYLRKYVKPEDKKYLSDLGRIDLVNL